MFVLCGFRLVSAGLAAFAWFCMVVGWSRLVSLRLYLVEGSTELDLGAEGCCIASSVCAVLYDAGLVSAGLAVLVGFCVDFFWSMLASL